MSIENTHAAGITLLDPFGTCKLAHRAHQRRHLGAARLHKQDHLGGTRRGIAAHIHRRGAGMAGQALHAYLEAAASGNLGHDAERQSAIEQHRALFDMDFDKASQCRRIDRRGAQASMSPAPGRPESASASRIVTPSTSARSSSAGSKRPASTLLARKLVLKRRPSSSANPTTSK
jgi:hypothetical protein